MVAEARIVARISDISGEVLDGNSGARLVLTYLDGRPPVELDISEGEAEAILGRRAIGTKRPRKAWTVGDKRKSHPRAYERWSPEEDAVLDRLHREGRPVKDMASELGRQVGAVRSRLVKLGRLPPSGNS